MKKVFLSSLIAVAVALFGQSVVLADHKIAIDSISNGIVDQTVAHPGDILVIRFTSTEEIFSPRVTVNGNEAIVAGAGTSWTANYEVRSSDTSGPIEVTVTSLHEDHEEVIMRRADFPIENDNPTSFDETDGEVVVVRSGEEIFLNNSGTPVVVIVSPEVDPNEPGLCDTITPYKTNVRTGRGFMSYHADLAAQDIVQKRFNCEVAHCNQEVTNAEVVGMALRMKKIELPEGYRCLPSHYDAFNRYQPNWICRAAEYGQAAGLIDRTMTAWEPNKSATRVETLKTMMKSVCMDYSQTNISGVAGFTRYTDEEKKVIITAMAYGLTKKDFLNFKPNKAISRGESWVFASRLTDWANVTGGCDPKPLQCLPGYNDHL